MGLIDAHCHLDAAFGGGWVERPTGELLDVLDAVGVDLLVDLSGGWGLDVLHRHLDHVKAAAPDRFAMFGGIDWAAWPHLGDGFPAAAERSLRAQVRRGASGLKVWKTLGLEALDGDGQLVAVDDPRLDQVWGTCEELGLPVVVHVGDPHEFFEPIGPANPRSDELGRHPEWHWHALAPVSFAELIDQFERLVARWPATTFVGAHALDLLHDPTRLEALLSEHENLFVDLGARFVELEAAGPAAVDLLVRHHDRFLYGLDHPPEVEQYERTIATTHRAIHEAHRTAGCRDRTDAAVSAIFGGTAAGIFRP
ncbi:MAG: amidohydrolase 2 family protein [Acidimicrobiales bacterium]|nr:amidohydrolase 2 family protein [Acidimicrobiales bacterium]